MLLTLLNPAFRGYKIPGGGEGTKSHTFGNPLLIVKIHRNVEFG